jgi:tetratricopeptide (TPR) repeat protein
MDHYLQGMAIKERIGDIYGQGVLANNIGEVYRTMGQLQEAISFYQRSLQVWEELGVTYGKGLIHNNLGAVYLRMGDLLEQATAHLDQSEALFAQIPSADFAAETARYRAEIALCQGQLDQALTFAGRSLQYAVDQGLKADECATRRVLGQIYGQLGMRAGERRTALSGRVCDSPCSSHRAQEKRNLERAQEYLSQSLDIARELDNRYEIGRTLLQMGLLQHKQGHLDQAQDALDQASAIFKALEASLDLAEVQAIQKELGRP